MIHEKPGNPHVHVMLTARPLSDTGFGRRHARVGCERSAGAANGKIQYKVWEDGRDVLRGWRETWANVANHHLERAGVEAGLITDRSRIGARRSRPTSISGRTRPACRPAVGRPRSSESTSGSGAKTPPASGEPGRADPPCGLSSRCFIRADVERVARRYLDDDDPSAIRDLVDQALALPNIVSTPSRVLDRRTGRMAETTCMRRAR